MANDPAPGGQTVGRYQILEELGRGAMGIVYKGHDPVIGRTIALKTIVFREGETEEAIHLRQRLYREACAAGTLAHSNIVTIYDVIEESGMTAVAMEFIEGQTLKDLIAARAPLALDEALDLFEQIAAALDYASLKKIVHRDIKPANIMITPDSRVKVADFGLARTPTSNLTKGSAIMGTPSYMSPEQARGMPLDGRSDVFSATVVLYEMVTREKPFAGRNLVEKLERIVNSPPLPPSQFNPAIGQAVTRVFERAFAKNPAERYKSGADLVSAMRKAAGNEDPTVDVEGKTVLMDAETVLMTPPGSVEPVLRTVRITPPVAFDPALPTQVIAPPSKAPSTKDSKRFAIAVAAAAVVLLTIGFVVIAMTNRTAPAPAPPVSRATIPVAPPQASEPRPARTNEPTVDPPAAPPVAVPAAPPERPSATKQPERAAAPAHKSTPPPIQESPPPPPRETPRAAAPTASVQLRYDGTPFPLTLLADGRQIGHVSDEQATVTIDAGRVRIRAVNEPLFLDHDFGTLRLAPGERRTLSVPGTATAFIGVRGENYTGLRILLDGRVLPGPYPAQLPRIAAAPHKIQFRWSEGVLQDVAITDTVDLSNGRQFIIRAVPEGGQVLVQKLK